jgi:hypothetical protein
VGRRTRRAARKKLRFGINEMAFLTWRLTPSPSPKRRGGLALVLVYKNLTKAKN